MTLITLTSVNAMQDAEVYRWVDENGNVHFSDLPKSEKAKLFFVKKGNSAKADKPEVENSTSNDTLTSEEDVALSNTLSDDEIEEYTENAKSCDFLRSEIKKAQTRLNGQGESQARLARIYIDTAQKMIAQGQCK